MFFTLEQTTNAPKLVSAAEAVIAKERNLRLEAEKSRKKEETLKSIQFNPQKFNQKESAPLDPEEIFRKTEAFQVPLPVEELQTSTESPVVEECVKQNRDIYDAPKPILIKSEDTNVPKTIKEQTVLDRLDQEILQPSLFDMRVNESYKPVQEKSREEFQLQRKNCASTENGKTRQPELVY